MKTIIALFFILFPVFSYSQHLEIIEIDTTGFPKLSAKYILFDEDFNLVKDLQKSECKIFENNISQKVTKIINPKDTNIMQSVVLVVDISGSMSGENLEISKEALREFVRLTPFSNTEIALITFDGDSYVNQDYTRNPNLLYQAIEKIHAGGGTDYDVALIEKSSSALSIAKRGSARKPIIVFLTDGLCSANFQQISETALEKDIKIFPITINMPIPNDLYEIALRTNSDYYENITNAESAKTAYLTILFNISHLYGRIYWTSDVSCDTYVNIGLKIRDKYSSVFDYVIPQFKTKGIYFDNQIVAYDKAGKASKKNITIKANSPAVIDSIYIKDTTYFSINYNFTLPAKIYPKNSLLIETYRKMDTINNKFTEVFVKTDVCEAKKFYIYKGDIASFVIPGSLQLVTPNGNEMFYAGETQNISWINKTGNKMINLFFSHDGGLNYSLIKTTKINNFDWIVPGVKSDRCLVKVSLNTKPILLNSDMLRVKKVEVDKNGASFLIVKGKEISIKSCGSNDTKLVIKSNNSIKDLKIEDDFSQLLYKTSSDQLFYSNLSQPDKSVKIRHKSEKILDYFLINGGGQILVFYKDNKSFFVFDSNTGKKQKKIKNKMKIIDVAIKNDLLSIVDQEKKWSVWDLNKYEKIYELQTKEGITQTDINANSEFIVALNKNNEFHYWNKTLVDTFLTVKYPREARINSIKFNPVDNTLFCYSTDKRISLFSGKTMFFDYKSPDEINIMKPKFNHAGTELIYGVNDKHDNTSYISRYSYETMNLSDTKNRIVFQSPLRDFDINKYTNIAVFSTEEEYLVYLLPGLRNAINDVSDTLFTVKSLCPEILDTIFMPTIFTGSYSYYPSKNIFHNGHKNTAIIDNIHFDGENKELFQIISGMPPFGIPPGEDRGVEIATRTVINRPGIYLTDFVANSADKEIKSVLKLKVVDPPVEDISETFNLGAVGMKETLSSSVELFKNISQDAYVIEKIELVGPDYSQIVITNELEGKSIVPGEKIKFQISFEGKKRGLTDALFLIFLKDFPQPLRLLVSGRVIAPDKIDVKFIISNVINASPGFTQIEIYDEETNRYLGSYQTDKKGILSIQLPNELSYKVVARNKSIDSKIVDLKEVFKDTLIIVDFKVLSYYDGLKYELSEAKFATGSSALNLKTKLELNKLAFLMNQFPEIEISVAGHTDNEGSLEQNMEVSTERAESVMNYLVSKGIGQERIKTKGYGYTKPVSENNTEEGKEKNRRIEITFSIKKS